MTQSTQRLIDYLKHIIDAIDRIQEYVSGMNEGDFLSNRMVQDAVIRNFEIIGEASNNICKKFPDFAKSHSAGNIPVASTRQGQSGQGVRR